MNNNRLLSLDILRGFDLFCLLMLQPILYQLFSILQLPALEPIFRQFDHVEWHGFSFWDIIMPLFMFMSGITIPFAMSKYKQGMRINGLFWKRLLKRFLILFALGWVVQGNLLGLDPNRFYIFSNTLQAIAVGYIFSVIFFVFFSLRWQIILTAALFSIYLLVFIFIGKMNFTPEGNIAEIIDQTVLGSFRDGVYWQDNTWSFSPHYRYTWILSSLNFVVTVMFGVFAGNILYNKTYSAIKKFYQLLLIGVLCVVAGLLIDPVFPIIKKIWSSSMTLLSGGYCFLLMALFYYVIDIKKFKGLDWLKYYGLNSIVAYTLFFVVSFRSIANSLFFGLQQYMGKFYPLILTAFQAAVVFLIVYYLYRTKRFFKA